LRYYAAELHATIKGLRSEFLRRGFFALSKLNPEEMTILIRSVDFVESFVPTGNEEERKRKVDYIWCMAEMYQRIKKLDDLVFLPWRVHSVYMADDGIPVDPEDLDLGYNDRPPPLHPKQALHIQPS
ncbi:uncharacterized protein LOC108253964, partial [Diaphorina citri]|uniref:Uncharacterized protein LOC108253964 n=1 Tax=Diaphorina citri TaxID=121845 RepID=A0A3Q0JLD3_DIACI